MKKLKDKILSFVYKIKWNLDLGVQQVTWITGKLPELMGFIYIAEKMGYSISRSDIIGISVFGILGLIVLGIFWKRSGLYDTEIYVGCSKNPYNAELLEAARLIKKNFKK